MTRGFSISIVRLRNGAVPHIHLHKTDSVEHAISWLGSDRSPRAMLYIAPMSRGARRRVLDALYDVGLEVVSPTRSTYATQPQPIVGFLREVPRLIRFALWPGPVLLVEAAVGRVPRKYLVYGGNRLNPPPASDGDPAGDRSPIGGPDSPPPPEAMVDPDKAA